MNFEDIFLSGKASHRRTSTVRFHSQEVPSAMESQTAGEVEGSRWRGDGGRLVGTEFQLRKMGPVKDVMVVTAAQQYDCA